MGEAEFIKLCKEEVCKYINNHKDSYEKNITLDSLYIVWLCKTLQNNKALISSSLPDGMYYECTYNGDKNEMYLDAYKKWENKLIKL